MIVWLIRYIRGYLDIKLSGVYSEKILSDLGKGRISVWHLKYQNTSIYCRMFAKDFRNLRKIRKSTGVRVRIIKKHGFPFFAKKYSHRFGFIAGAAIFLAVLKFLSGFIWIINVNGNNAVKTVEIIKTLGEIGIYESISKSKVDSKNDAQSLLLMRNDLAWASLNIEGCVLNVNVSEIKKEKNKDNGDPSNIVAKCDGIIRKIDAVSGDVRVKIGDNVHTGDVLVSGIIESMSSTVFVQSHAVVTAQIEKTYKVRENYIKEIKIKTGKTDKKAILDILSVKIPLFLERAYNNAKITYSVSQGRLLGKKIPIRVYKKQLEFYKTNKISISEDEIKSILEKRWNDYLSKHEIEGYIPIATAFISDDTGVVMTNRYLCDESIGVQSRIIMGE